jgi:GntR family transcriptional regulator/MocR family aminotransferase
MEPVFPFDVRLPARGAGRIARDLHHQLRAASLEGRLVAGAALPATRRVAEALGIGRNTAVTAYDLLIAEGYVVPRAGAKAVVAEIAQRVQETRRGAKSRAVRAGDRAEWGNPCWSAVIGQMAPRGPLPPRCFRLGLPEHRYFPHAAWRRLVAQSLRQIARRGFAYGPSEGIPELRDAIAQHVAFARAVACTADDVVVTSCAQQAFALLALKLITPARRRVAVEDPGYPACRFAMAAAGAELVPTPVDEEGLIVERLPPGVHVICVTPSHQSPTGVAMSLRRRRELLEYARRNDAVIVEDDYDGEFRYGARPLDALQTLDREARVFYVGTFTKSLFPELRKGFVVAPAWARPGLVEVKYLVDSHSDTAVQMALATFIRDGHLARYVRRMRGIYAERREAVMEGLSVQLAEWVRPIPSEAGLHVAAHFLRKREANAILRAAAIHTPGAVSISNYAMSRDVEPGIVMGYGVIDAGEIGPAMAKLRKALSGRL